MFAAFALIVLIGLCATTHAHHHHVPCQSSDLTGMLSVMAMKGELKATGPFTYDATGNRLRLQSLESFTFNVTFPHLDLLMLFQEGVLYEIDSKNQGCKKKAMQSTIHPLQIPKDATFLTVISVGNPAIVGEGLKLNVWIGTQTEFQAAYSMSVSLGCLPLSMFYFSESSVLFSVMELETGVKDPDLLVVPSYCQGLAVEETVKNFLHMFA